MTLDELKAALDRITGNDPISKARRRELIRQINELSKGGQDG